MSTKTTTLLFLFIITLKLFSQQSYSILVKSEIDERGGYIEHGPDNGVLFNITKPSQIENIFVSSLYFVDNNGDTTLWQQPYKQDSLMTITSTYKLDDNFYFVGNYAVINGDSLLGHCDFLIKLDLNFDIVWEKIYTRPLEISQGIWIDSRSRIVVNNNNFIMVKRMANLGPPTKRTYFLKVNQDGDSLSSRLYSSYISGDLNSLTYNYDSSKLILHKNGQYLPGCFNGGGAFLVDTISLDTCGSICYNDTECSTDFQPDGMLMYDGSTIVSGMNWCTSDGNSDHYLFVRKYDSTFNEVKTIFLTNKDTLSYTWGKNLDINFYNEIFVVGTYSYGGGPYPQTYDWIYLAKLDQDLNLITERYLGHDASYAVMGLLANDDGSVLISGMRYDYLENNNENDAFLFKTTPDLWVNLEDKYTVPIHSAICYPNPGIKSLNIRTTIYNSDFMLYDEYGRLIQTTKIDNTTTRISTYKLNSGVYFWKLVKNNTIVDNGKWIKN